MVSWYKHKNIHLKQSLNSNDVMDATTIKKRKAIFEVYY